MPPSIPTLASKTWGVCIYDEDDSVLVMMAEEKEKKSDAVCENETTSHGQGDAPILRDEPIIDHHSRADRRDCALYPLSPSTSTLSDLSFITNQTAIDPFFEGPNSPVLMVCEPATE